MAEVKPKTKTRQTDQSVEACLDAIAGAAPRPDCRELVKLMGAATNCEPKMWGIAIVGFGSCHYKYASGHEGEACVTGFALRKSDISMYLMCEFEGHEALFAKPGKDKMGKTCRYVRRLSDIDLPILEQLVLHSVAEVKCRYPPENLRHHTPAPSIFSQTQP